MDAPRDLRERGLQFWNRVTEEVDLDASGLLLLGEACRIIDRLDKLSANLNGHGRSWLKLADDIEKVVSRDGSHKVRVEVVVDGLLSEGRQQQLALKTILAQLGLAKATEKQNTAKSALQAWLEEQASGN